MGIIVHDNYVTREGISIENYYASFSKNITINKIRCISRSEITKEQADLDSDSWNITTPALDSSGNFIFVPKLDSSGNVIMEVESPPVLKLDASGNIIKTSEYDLSKNLIERTPVLIKKTITKYYTVHKETKYQISASLVCYINKDVRLKSLTNNFDHSNVGEYDNMLYNRVGSEKNYNYIERFNIEIISDNTNNIYEQLYEKVKSMNIFSDYTDDL